MMNLTNDSLLDDDALIFNDDALVLTEESQSDEAATSWKIMLVDDDVEVHQVTKLALKRFTFEGKSLNILSAYSSKEAKHLIEDNLDIAIILLDVVMETNDAGLMLAKHIREVLKNTLVRIILRTGQPGEAPEESVVLDYDINDYKTKLELTQRKLFTTMVAALRSYRDVIALENSRKELAVLNASLRDFNQNLEQLVRSRTQELEAKNLQLQKEISDRVLVEAALDVSEEKFYKVFCCTPHAIAITRLSDGLHIEVNDSFCRLTGYANEEIIGRTAIELNLWVNMEDRNQLFHILIKNGTVRNYEFSFSTKVGEIKTALLSAEIIEICGEACVIAVSQDISDRKLAEEKIRASEANLAAAQRIAHIGNWEFDINAQKIIWSKEVFRIFGFDPTQPEPNFAHLVQVIHPDDRELWQQITNQAIASGTPYEIEHRILLPDGSIRHIEARGEVVLNPQGQAIKLFGTAMDISDRKQTELALQQAMKAAEKANRSKSEFLANMSHELRTPLNAILGFTQLMTRDSSLSTEQQKHLGIISSSGEHLLDLINSVLEMSKIEAGRVTLNENSFDLYRLLNSIQEMMQLKVKSKALQLIFDVAPEVPQYIQTDESKLRQVLINLLGNAIKFTQKGGVTLRVVSRQSSVVREELSSCKIKTLSVSHNIQTFKFSNFKTPTDNEQLTIHFEVEDTGLGIAPEELDGLFEAFVQTQTGKKSQSGTGLGLPISRKFVQLMGGDITVSSILDQGTIFKFDVQIGLAQAHEVQTGSVTKRAIALAPEQPAYRLLVVDDRFESRLFLVKLLESVGFEVREAENGQEAIAIWESWEPHLIWMDMRMPVMDGYEATKRIKAHLKGQATVIIALTASALEEERSIVLCAGCDDFVRKPFREEAIFEKMVQYLGVRYIYQEPPAIAPGRVSPPCQGGAEGENPDSSYILNSTSFQLLPAEWVAQLHQASLCGKDRLMLELIEQIPAPYENLASALLDLVENFEFDRISNLTQPNTK